MARPPIHPGEILADELEELGISATALSRALDVPTNRITQIINGQRAITAETALRLGQWFGTSADFWLNLQKQYELRLAEQEYGQKIRETVSPRVAHILSPAWRLPKRVLPGQGARGWCSITPGSALGGEIARIRSRSRSSRRPLRPRRGCERARDRPARGGEF